jgi:anthranilate synthase/aminodeoxychorismate synthase-like glutamine amidotransferase
MIDNYDSFTYNVVQYFLELGQKVVVKRNDELNLQDIKEINPQYICISPGPATPNEAGITLECIQEFAGQIPILGVCLGHQAIAQVFGASVIINYRQMHGKASIINHDNRGVFKNLPQPLKGVRYHSLIVDRSSLPNVLEISASTEEGEIMGLRHKTLALEGVQFHPESILSEAGHQLLKNFLDMYK